MAERLALPTSDHGVTGSNPAGGEILPEPKRRFIAQSLSCSPFHRLEMTEILLKGRKTLTHPSNSEPTDFESSSKSSKYPVEGLEEKRSGDWIRRQLDQIMQRVTSSDGVCKKTILKLISIINRRFQKNG